nr:hypothetical protein [Rhodothermus marinus]
MVELLEGPGRTQVAYHDIVRVMVVQANAREVLQCSLGYQQVGRGALRAEEGTGQGGWTEHLICRRLEAQPLEFFEELAAAFRGGVRGEAHRVAGLLQRANGFDGPGQGLLTLVEGAVQVEHERAHVPECFGQWHGGFQSGLSCSG